ncbi:hypothetical protein GCM10010495_79930 [Kitasatospora herbaricolor]|nr:hypothetical protein GCM10010495_79930 [Kitasatospora herbaricolor]
MKTSGPVSPGSVGDVGQLQRAGPALNLVEKIWTHSFSPCRPAADGSASSLGAARFQGFDAGTQGGELIKRLGQCQLQCLYARRRPPDGHVPRLPVI